MSVIHMETEQVREVAEMMGDASLDLQRAYEALRRDFARLSTSWQGGGAEMFHSKMGPLNRQFLSLTQDLQTLSQRLIREVDKWILAAQHLGEGMQVTQCSGSESSGGDKGVKGEGRGARGIDQVDTEIFILDGVEVDYYKGYLRGDLSFEEIKEFLKKDPLRKKIVTSKASFYEKKWVDRNNAAYSLKEGPIQASLFTTSASLATRAIYQDRALQTGVKGDVGAYFGRVEYGAEIAGAAVAADAYLGGEATFSGGMAFSPSQGEIGLKGDVDAFVGGKVEAQADYNLDIGNIEGDIEVKGGIAYGIGAKAKADIGLNKGHLRAEVQLGASVGLGAEFGIGFDLDVQKAVSSVVHSAKDALNWIYM